MKINALIGLIAIILTGCTTQQSPPQLTQPIQSVSPDCDAKAPKIVRSGRYVQVITDLQPERQ
jgi:type IV pili sensor histidine kinase/response regulator